MRVLVLTTETVFVFWTVFVTSTSLVAMDVIVAMLSETKVCTTVWEDVTVNSLVDNAVSVTVDVTVDTTDESTCSTESKVARNPFLLLALLVLNLRVRAFEVD